MEITKAEPPWPSKYNEDGILEVPRVSLPFQFIEAVSESRATRKTHQNQSRPELDTLRSLIVDKIKNEMFTERDNRKTTMSLEEILEARDEGRA